MNNRSRYLTYVLLFSVFLISGSELIHHHESDHSPNKENCTICYLHSHHTWDNHSGGDSITEPNFEDFIFSESTQFYVKLHLTSASDRAPPK